MKTSATIDFIETSSGKKGQRAITDINPLATTEAILGFVHDLVGLTDNTYEKTTRIQSINVDTEEIPIPASKQIPTLSIGTPTVSSTELQVPYSYNGDGTLHAVILYKQDSSQTANYKTTTIDTTNHVIKSDCYYGQSYDYYFYLVSDETNTFYSSGIYQLIRF